MYKFIRNTHLLFGFLAIPFLLVYALSSVFFSHPSVDLSRIKSETSHLSLPAIPGDVHELARLLEEEHGMRGELADSAVNAETKSINLTIARPGKRYLVEANLVDNSLQVIEKTANAVHFVNVLHKTAGIAGSGIGERAWGFAVLLLAIVLTLLIGSGIWLWLLRARERRAGILFLGSSLLYGIIVFVVIRLG
jgi:hypothetical protein